jgi:hypothetical protein
MMHTSLSGACWQAKNKSVAITKIQNRNEKSKASYLSLSLITVIIYNDKAIANLPCCLSMLLPTTEVSYGDDK